MDKLQMTKETCYVCGVPLKGGKRTCVHPGLPPQIHKFVAVALATEGTENFSVGVTSLLRN